VFVLRLSCLFDAAPSLPVLSSASVKTARLIPLPLFVFAPRPVGWSKAQFMQSLLDHALARKADWDRLHTVHIAPIS
jgi:hypothetical protein